MNELITAAIRDEDLQTLTDFPTELCNEFEQSILSWIFEYARKYAQIPEVERLEREFPHFVPITSSDPIGDIFDRTLLHKKRLVANSLVADLTENLRDEHFDPTKAIANVAHVLNRSETGLVKYSTFDRSEYFKPRTPLKFHFPLIDKVTGGLLNGDLGYLVGRLGTGKSTTAQWCTHQWWKDGKRILFVSNEMLPIDVLMRLDAMVGEFNPRELRMHKKTIKLKKQVKVVSHIAAKAEGEIILPKRRLMTPAAIIGIAIQLNVDVIVIDGVYLLHPERYVAAKWERVAEVSNQLKQGALELGIPILGITQLRRMGPKEKADVEDIAYSDALGQDSDVILTIAPTDKPNTVTLELIKNRFGDATIGTTITIDWDRMTLIDSGAAPSL